MSLATKIQGLLAMNGLLYIIFIFHYMYCLHNKKQITGVEPAFPAWEASVLPMNHICMRILYHLEIKFQGNNYIGRKRICEEALNGDIHNYLSMLKYEYESK